MENRDTVVSDIERNKEIFEYEMTEVLIKLKGEFAVMRGEELNGGNIGMRAAKVDIDYKAPEFNISAPDNMSTELPQPSEYKSVKISSPHIGGIKMPEISQFGGMPEKSDRGETPAQMLKKFEETFVIPKADVNSFVIKRETDIKIECKSIPNFIPGEARNFVFGQNRESISKDIKAGIPKLKTNDIGKTFASREFGRLPNKALEIPKIRTNISNIHLSSNPVIPCVAAVERLPIVKVPGVSMNALKKCIADIDSLRTGDVGIGNAAVVNVPSYDPTVIDAVHQNNIGVSDRVGIPVIDINFTKPIFEEIKMSKAAPPDLPEVAEKPDFSGYIADILDSLKD